MNLETLKQKIVATVDSSHDEALLQDVMDMLAQHAFNTTEANINDTDLTQLCMATSEKSLAEAWDNEDNERWNAFLKN